MSTFQNHQPPIFQLSQLQEIRQHFEQDGYAVVAVPSVDLGHLKSLFLRDLHAITDQPRTAENLFAEDTHVPESAHHGLLGEYGLSQGDSAWYVRTNKDIISLYQQLLGTDDVVCSFDAVGFSTDAPVPEQLNGRCWLHVDQNPHVMPSADYLSIQGIFYAEDSHGDRAATVVVPGSPRDWKLHKYSSGSNHFQIVDQSEYVPRAVKLDIPAGCLLLFSSRTVHQGWYGPHRLCYMVCYGKKENRTEEIRKRKVMMYLGGHRSTHWSQFGQYHGYKWLPDTHWQLLNPTVTDQAKDSKELLLELLEDFVTDEKHYEPRFDEFIPADRLKLI